MNIKFSFVSDATKFVWDGFGWGELRVLINKLTFLGTGVTSQDFKDILTKTGIEHLYAKHKFIANEQTQWN